MVTSQIGEELYEKFFQWYTKKQWDIFPDELSPEVTARIPVRFNRDDRYFTDRYQGVPEYGYTRLFENLIDSKNIHILLNTDYKEVINEIKFEKLIYTGPIDYFLIINMVNCHIGLLGLNLKLCLANIINLLLQ